MSREYQEGTWLVICDICGVQRYQHECQFTWDGHLACTVNNCWSEKHPMDDPQILPNDPYPVPFTRPDLAAGNEREVPPVFMSTWDFIVNTKAINGNITWDALDKPWNDIDTPDSLF